jgi:N-acetylneuraminic acid mutarotase
MIMFGGSGGNYSFNDLYKFDMRSQKWTKLEPLGELPSPREGHTAKVIGQDKMMVHGGVDQSEKIFNDTYVLTGINPYISNEQTSSIYLAYLPMYSEEQRLAEMNSLM